MPRPTLAILLTATLALAILASCSKDSQEKEGGASCGFERWPVKTLIDLDAGRVDLTPMPSTVSSLRALKAPGNLPQNGRVAPVEVTMYQIVAQVKEFKLEDDKDLHVVVTTPGAPSETIIVELADPDCEGPNASSQQQAMRSARRDFIAICGQPQKRFIACNAPVRVTGVGFFDFIHGQRGLAPNGIELHPVLAMERVTP